VITWQLTQIAGTLEAGWWQVLRGSVSTGQRVVSQILDVFGLEDFTMLHPVLAWLAVWNLGTIYFFDFQKKIFFGL
jgi:hypothetical protein